MRTSARLSIAAAVLFCAACGPAEERSAPPGADAGTLARVYFWKARPGSFEEYTRYIHERAEPIDEEARRHGAFLSVATYMTEDSASPWTHMRVFILRDSTQLAGLSGALAAAGARLEPDSVKRREAGEYSAGLRDPAGSATLDILR